MTVREGENGVIELLGQCDSSDAEILQSRLLAFKGATVDWRQCDTVHTAVLQVMLTAGVVPIGPPRGKFLTDMLEPLLKRCQKESGVLRLGVAGRRIGDGL